MTQFETHSICVLRKPAIEESFLDSVNNTQTGPLPQQPGNRVGDPSLTGAIDTALQVLACAVKAGSENQRHTDRKGRSLAVRLPAGVRAPGVRASSPLHVLPLQRPLPCRPHRASFPLLTCFCTSAGLRLLVQGGPPGHYSNTRLSPIKPHCQGFFVHH